MVDCLPLEFPEFKLNILKRLKKTPIKAIVVFDSKNNLTIDAIQEIAKSQALGLYHQCKTTADIDVIEFVELSKIEGWCVIVQSRI